MTPIDQLQKAVEARLEGLLGQASKKEPSYAEFLQETLSCEVDARRTRYLRARLQLAHLPLQRPDGFALHVEGRHTMICRKASLKGMASGASRS